MQPTKARQVRVYLRDRELQMLSELVERTGMKDTAVLSLLCGAALRATKDADYKVPLVLRFRVAEGLEPQEIRKRT